jgi:hypothetical protein
MVVKVSKPEINVREKISELDKPSGTAGQAMLAAETPHEQQALIGVGRRNLIINGDMRIAQRGTSYTGTNGFSLDRWRNSENTDGVTTLSQQSDGPYTEDGHFKYYLQINVDTADTSMAAAQYAGAFYKVEGYDFDCAGYGNSQAKTLTLSFWHAHSEPGIYCIAFRNDGGGSNRNYVLEYTQDVANVWQKTTITFPGDTSGTWTETNTAALSIFWTFCQGSQYATTTLNQWFGGIYYHASTNIINMMATQNAKFRMTGVQLELGKVATPFEHRSYGEELALCQRYYYQVGKSNGGVISSFGFARGPNYLNLVYATVPRLVAMRAVPTVSGGGNIRGTSFTGGYQTKNMSVTGNGRVVGHDQPNQNSTVSGIRVEFLSNWPAAEVVISDHDGTGFISFDAEL